MNIIRPRFSFHALVAHFAHPKWGAKRAHFGDHWPWGKFKFWGLAKWQVHQNVAPSMFHPVHTIRPFALTVSKSL